MNNMKKTWNLINELNSRNCRNTTNIKEVKIGNQVLDSSNQMAEAFNTYFSNVGSNLADEIPSTSDFKPPTDKTFSIQLPSIENVKRLLKNIDEKKSVGLELYQQCFFSFTIKTINTSLLSIEKLCTMLGSPV